MAAELRLTDGAERVVSTLKGSATSSAIISGGFDYFGKYFQASSGSTTVFANQLEIADGKLTGQAQGRHHRRAARRPKSSRPSPWSRTSASSRPSPSATAPTTCRCCTAGLGVAFHAKPIVRANADRSISFVGLDGLLYLMGISEREIRQA